MNACHMPSNTNRRERLPAAASRLWASVSELAAKSRPPAIASVGGKRSAIDQHPVGVGRTDASPWGHHLNGNTGHLTGLNVDVEQAPHLGYAATVGRSVVGAEPLNAIVQ